MNSRTNEAGLLSSDYCAVYLTNQKNNYFMFGAGQFLMTRKVRAYIDKIVFGRSVLKPGFVLHKKDVDTVELFRSFATGLVQNVRITHHDIRVFSPITIEQYEEDLEALQKAGYPFESK